MHLDEKGRGRALHAVWSASDAQVLAYMDVDLSTDLAALLPLVAPLLSGHSDLAIGTRLVARLARRARPQARGHLALLQRHPARRPARRASPTRSAASRRSAPTAPASCCRSCTTARGSSTPSCSCSPSAPACASTRCRSTGSTIPTRASTSSRRRSPTSAASRGWRAICAPTACRSRCVSTGATARRASAARCCGSPPSASSRRSPTPSSTSASAPSSPPRPRTRSRCSLTAVGNTAANRRFTFAIRGSGGTAPPPGPGARRLRPRARAHRARRSRCSTRSPRSVARGRARRARRRQPRRDDPALRPVPRLGLPRPPRRTATQPATTDGRPMSATTTDAALGGAARTGAAARLRLRSLIRGRAADPAWVRPALLVAARGDGAALPGRPRRQRLGERVLLGRGPGRHEELEGVLLRLVRLVQLHHRRQAAGRRSG